MRIIAGKAGRTAIKVPSAVARPTTDFIRQAIFSILGERIDGARALVGVLGNAGRERSHDSGGPTHSSLDRRTPDHVCFNGRFSQRHETGGHFT